MSHFTTVKTQMVDLASIEAGLKDLGYSVEVGSSVAIRGYRSSSKKAQLKAYKAGSEYDIGFVKDGSSYSIVADWWGVGDTNQDDFERKLMPRYAYHATLSALLEQGFAVANEHVENNGQVHLVLRRMV